MVGRDVFSFLPLLSLTPSWCAFLIFHHFFSFQFLSFFISPLSLNLIQENLFHLYSFFPFFLSPLSPFFHPSVLSDYSGDGPVKASPIIVFEQHCSLALCSSETRLFSICSLYHTNTGQLCLFSLDRKFITFIFT